MPGTLATMMETTMADGNSKTQEISLGSDFDAVVRYGETTVELKADGNVVVKTNGNATVYTSGDVKVRPAANDDKSATIAAEPKVGDRMADGTIFAGISPDTNQPMYVTPKDAPLTMKWKAAMEYAAKLDAHGHKDWRAPTKGELNVLFENSAAIGGFDISSSGPAGWYWSSAHINIYAWAQRFSDGGQDRYYQDGASALRCVR
jgi:hypothetical protein